jgi:hypothetical protein
MKFLKENDGGPGILYPNCQSSMREMVAMLRNFDSQTLSLKNWVETETWPTKME